MESGDQDPEQRAQALAHLERFADRHLPAALRRLGQWKGFDARRQLAVLDDVRQELALDCLMHPAEVTALEQRARHARWFRIVQLVHYRLCARVSRTESDSDLLDWTPARDTLQPDALADSLLSGLAQPAAVRELSPESRQALAAVQVAAQHMKNGRLNAHATAKALGVPRRRFHKMWEQLVAELGFGKEYVAFWRRRLREALLQHAADLLRAAGAVALCYEEERAPADPQASRRRIERVRAALSSHAPTPDLRVVFATALSAPAPAQVVELAGLVAPSDPAVDLWRFEAAVAYDDLGAAARALRAARRHGAPRVPLALARARLWEAQERPGDAARVLRAEQRHGDDARLRASLARLE